MKRGRKARGELATRRLLELWEPPDEAGPPIGCVATTYTFDAEFFETECLGRFAGIESDPDEDDRAFAIEREEKLSEIVTCVLVDQRKVPTARCVRWHVLPIRVKPPGVFHAKLTVLVWRDHVRVLVGSANLTVRGYRENLENVAAFDYRDGQGGPFEVLDGAIDFIERVAKMAPGGDAAAGPHVDLAGLLARLRRATKGWSRPSVPVGSPRAYLVSVEPGGGSLFESIGSRMSGTSYTKVRVTSPFFDDGDGAKEVAEALLGVMARRADVCLEFVASGRKTTQGVDLDLPAALGTSWRSSVQHILHMAESFADKEYRPLHAKTLWFKREDDRALYCVGSSNFTRAGTGLRKLCNVELNVLYDVPPVADDFRAVCRASQVPHIRLDPSTVTFAPARPLDRDDVANEPLLPAGLGAASYDPRTGLLSLEVLGAVPPDLTVKAEAGRILVAAGALDARTGTIAWGGGRPPTYVVVEWSEQGEPQRAVWVVNVTDLAALPAPEALKDLDLETLLAILTSSRPAHEVIRERQGGGKRRRKGDGTSLNPHARVSTGHHLLAQMKRLSTALEGVRERLGRPVVSVAALQARIEGPYGPVTLAHRLVEAYPDIAAFMVLEIARTVADTPADTSGGLSAMAAKAVKASCIDRLAALAKAGSAPANLKDYVDDGFGALR